MEGVLAGRVAVVTGAGRGIGRAIALGYGQAGASVVCAARTTGEVEAVAAAIVTAGGRALAVTADVTVPAEVETLFARAVEAFGPLDMVVLNAGGNFERHAVADSDPDEWERTLRLNLIAPYLCARAAIPHLKRPGGKVITLGSGLGHRGQAGGSAYACSKAGLWMLTRVLAQELASEGISVNELIPGPVETTIDDGTVPSVVAGLSGEWHKQPEDVVPLAVFLASQPAIGPTAQSFSLMRRDT